MHQRHTEDALRSVHSDDHSHRTKAWNNEKKSWPRAKCTAVYEVHVRFPFVLIDCILPIRNTFDKQLQMTLAERRRTQNGEAGVNTWHSGCYRARLKGLLLSFAFLSRWFFSLSWPKSHREGPTGANSAGQTAKTKSTDVDVHVNVVTVAT